MEERRLEKVVRALRFFVEHCNSWFTQAEVTKQMEWNQHERVSLWGVHRREPKLLAKRLDESSPYVYCVMERDIPSLIEQYFSNIGEDSWLNLESRMEDDICAICLDPPKMPQVLTKCGHFFCQDCLQPWVEKWFSCPTCRADIESMKCVKISYQQSTQQTSTIRPESVQSPLVQSQPVQSQPVKSQPVQSQPVQSQPVKSQPVQSIQPQQGFQITQTLQTQPIWGPQIQSTQLFPKITHPSRSEQSRNSGISWTTASPQLYQPTPSCYQTAQSHYQSVPRLTPYQPAQSHFRPVSSSIPYQIHYQPVVQSIPCQTIQSHYRPVVQSIPHQTIQSTTFNWIPTQQPVISNQSSSTPTFLEPTVPNSRRETQLSLSERRAQNLTDDWFADAPKK